MKLKILLVFAAIALAATTNVNGALDIYVWTESPFLAGEVTTAPSGGVCPVRCGPGAWQLFSFSWGVANPLQHGVGGINPGQPAFSDLSLQKMLDSASVGALLMVAQGTHFGAVTLSFVETTSPPFLSYEIKMENVFFSSVQHSGSAGGDDRPTESVSFAYDKITWTYHPRPSAGNPNPPAITHFWDLRTNTGG
jgi:type VI secretion system secreted protein Hcp